MTSLTRLPCRGCLKSCKNYTTCQGYPWRLPIERDIPQKAKQLLIVAHGSRREDSNEEVRTLAKKVSSNLQLLADDVVVAFLEITSPSIGTTIDNCFNRGTDEVVVLPYFLSSGNHVVNDLPRELENALAKWPGKVITTLPHIGASDEMVNLIAKVY